MLTRHLPKFKGLTSLQRKPAMDLVAPAPTASTPWKL